MCSSIIWRPSASVLINRPPTKLPPDGGFPALWWLSGLTCNDQNFCQKATPAFAAAAKEGLALVIPDTSPRGAGVAGEDESWDFGTGAGFYLDATKAPFAENYNMYSYVASELPALLAGHGDASWRISPALRSISGHSMGGHGALTVAFKNPEGYASVSAFAPIVDPANCPWGQKALAGYLQGGAADPAAASYSAVALLQARGAGGFKDSLGEILVDQGLDDEFLPQLCPGALEAAAAAVGQPLTFRNHQG